MTAKWIAVFGLGLLAVQASAEENRPPETQKEKMGYAMGVAAARNIQRQPVELDADALAKGFHDALSGGKLLMSDEDLRAAMSDARAELKQKEREAATAKKDRKAAGEAFRAENAKKEGVVTLASGVQYKVLKAGEGKTPDQADTVRCHYRGSSIEGRVFDSSYRRGKPVKIAIAGTSPGWREVLTLMPVGSKWQVVIPPEPARRGRKSKLGRDETAVFEIELLAIDPRHAGEKTASAPAEQQK
ncbi:MAG TPA: FKBP-type peptidyl-prolyl cis-trans isomerase [Anaeromyxobacteraceae bacterium]|nr:FKBP-type peptidyl-prolyl cis-trans isomerase [Anaeromyxobacteraceae bacterium]